MSNEIIRTTNGLLFFFFEKGLKLKHENYCERHMIYRYVYII